MQEALLNGVDMWKDQFSYSELAMVEPLATLQL